VGNLTLSGHIFAEDISSYTYHLSIPASGYIVLANDASLFTLPDNEGLIINTTSNYPEFDIPDREALSIDLIVDEQVVDNFFVWANRMQTLNGNKESLHKVLLNSGTIITKATTNDRENIKKGYKANP
jgi:hypothetical protein